MPNLNPKPPQPPPLPIVNSPQGYSILGPGTQAQMPPPPNIFGENTLRVTANMVDTIRNFMLAAIFAQTFATFLMVLLLYVLDNKYLQIAVITITLIYSLAAFHMVIHQWRIFMARLNILN